NQCVCVFGHATVADWPGGVSFNLPVGRESLDGQASIFGPLLAEFVHAAATAADHFGNLEAGRLDGGCDSFGVRYRPAARNDRFHGRGSIHFWRSQTTFSEEERCA